MDPRAQGANVIEWIWPWLLLLLPLPLLARRLLPPAGNEEAALRAPFFRDWQTLSERQGGAGSGSDRFSILALWLIWLGLVLASARPMWIGEPIELPNSGRDLIPIAAGIRELGYDASRAVADRCSQPRRVCLLDERRHVAKL